MHKSQQSFLWKVVDFWEALSPDLTGDSPFRYAGKISATPLDLITAFGGEGETGTGDNFTNKSWILQGDCDRIHILNAYMFKLLQ